jgi:leucyl aminopeptidase (aminopeptidase T)
MAVLSEKIAKSVVKDSLSITKGDTVLISTWQHMIGLANSIALECHKTGAKTLINLSTDETFYGSMLLEPVESLKKPNNAMLSLWDGITKNLCHFSTSILISSFGQAIGFLHFFIGQALKGILLV